MLAAALKEGYSVDRLYELTKIDRWFLNKMMNIVAMCSDLQAVSVDDLTKELIWQAKKLGFSDKQVRKFRFEKLAKRPKKSAKSL